MRQLRYAHSHISGLLSVNYYNIDFANENNAKKILTFPLTYMSTVIKILIITLTLIVIT